MLSKLLYKEFKLALHPASVLFLLLSSMMLIPNYPMYVLFFYNTLGIFFICLSGRENHDFAYSLSLPIRKRDAVRARIVFAVILQLAQCVLAVGFMFVRRTPLQKRQRGGFRPRAYSFPRGRNGPREPFFWYGQQYTIYFAQNQAFKLRRIHSTFVHYVSKRLSTLFPTLERGVPPRLSPHQKKARDSLRCPVPFSLFTQKAGR